MVVLAVSVGVQVVAGLRAGAVGRPGDQTSLPPTTPVTRPRPTTTVKPTTTQPATTTTVATVPPTTTTIRPRSTTTLTISATTVPPPTTTSSTTTTGTTTPDTTTTTVPPLPVTPAPPGPTLVALTSAGQPFGPPGVGLDVIGVNYPASCSTAYFFFDSIRIGSAPVHNGRGSRRGLSVPGSVHSGGHQVSTRCTPSGPNVQTAPFRITNRGVHRTAFLTSLNQPRQIRVTLQSIGFSALIAGLLLLLLGFPSQVFNSTLQEHYEEVRGWFGMHRSISEVVGDLNQRILFPLFLAAGGVLYALLTPDFGFNLSTLALASGLAIAVAVTTVGFALPTFAYFRVRYHDRGQVLVMPGTVLIGAAFVLLSRLLHFQPGYLYGLLAVFVFHHEVDKRTGGRLAAVAALSVMGLAVLAWVARVPVSGATMKPGVSFWTVLIESALCGAFIIGLESTLVGLLPLRFLDGSRIKEWSRAAWAALFVFALMVLIQVLVQPGSGYVGHTSRLGKITVLALYLVFAGFSFGFWAYFRYRRPRIEDELADEGDYGVR